MSMHAMSLNALAARIEALQTPRSEAALSETPRKESLNDQPVNCPPPAPGHNDYDGSLGLRQPAEHRAAFHKAEGCIHLFSGFVSRDDLSAR